MAALMKYTDKLRIIGYSLSVNLLIVIISTLESGRMGVHTYSVPFIRGHLG